MTILAQVAIGVSKDAELAILADDNDAITKPSKLVLQTKYSSSYTYSRIDLGIASKQRIDFIIECLERLKVHASG